MPITLEGVGTVFELEEIATMFKISIDTLRRYEKKNRIVTTQLGRKKYVTSDELTRFFQFNNEEEGEDERQKEKIIDALKQSENNKTLAAQSLGISRAKLCRLLIKHSLGGQEKQEALTPKMLKVKEEIENALKSQSRTDAAKTLGISR